MNQKKIAIIGAGDVGTTTAFALMLKNIPAELILVDINCEKCEGEVCDLEDAIPFCTTGAIKAGSFAEAGSADIVIIAAGARQKPGQTREELIAINKKIIVTIIDALQPINKDMIMIMVTNHVDVLTLWAQEHAQLPRHQIFGSGTLLDTQRLREILGHQLNIGSQSISAYVLGEHGDSQFVAWSSANIAGIPLLTYLDANGKSLDVMSHQVCKKAYTIIESKGATFYGIAASVATICQAIIYDQQCVLPLSVYQEQHKICMSSLVVLGEKGIIKMLDIPLNEQERKLQELSIIKIQQLVKVM